MNPSFKPPPPLSDVVRQKIYIEFMGDPNKNSVRVLSQRYHLSLKRVDAILRLKGLEHAWYKVNIDNSPFCDLMSPKYFRLVLKMA